MAPTITCTRLHSAEGGAPGSSGPSISLCYAELPTIVASHSCTYTHECTHTHTYDTHKHKHAHTHAHTHTHRRAFCEHMFTRTLVSSPDFQGNFLGLMGRSFPFGAHTQMHIPSKLFSGPFESLSAFVTPHASPFYTRGWWEFLDRFGRRLPCYTGLSESLRHTNLHDTFFFS